MPDSHPIHQQLQMAFSTLTLADASRPDVLPYRVAASQVPAVARHLHDKMQARLALLWAVDGRPGAERHEVHYLFALASGEPWVLLTLTLEAGERLFPSVTPFIHSAQWFEREIRDLFGLIPQGHPDLRRLVRHEHWPKGTHPLKKKFDWNQAIGRQQGEFRFRHIEGEGVFEVPVGPIHAGIIEPGHFRFSVAGEPIMQLEVRHFWKHRGVEKLFEQRPLTDAVPLAERISGDTSVGHALAYCQAAEQLMGIRPPRRARWLRSWLLELERLHNHLGDVGAICNDTAYAVAHSHASRMKERVLQINDQLTGSRFLRGLLCVGGLTRDLPHLSLQDAMDALAPLEQDFSELEAIIVANASLTDRLETTGVLAERVAWDHGVVGVVGRASGLNQDVRRDRPFAAYDEVSINVPVYRYGDVRARLRIRIDEIHESLRLLRDFHRTMPVGPIVARAETPPIEGQWALSAVEGWRGEILYFLQAGLEGTIHRCKVRDPSFMNWPAIQWAAVGNIIPDFPLINKSFNLSYAGNDL